MAFTDNPLFLRTLARQADPDPHAEPRERLRSALFKLRERAEVLAGEIHRDLPDFTVHDITHLDALWEMADLIAALSTRSALGASAQIARQATLSYEDAFYAAAFCWRDYYAD